MNNHLESVTMSHDTSWTWNVLPLFAAALALGIVFFPQGTLPGDAVEVAEATAAQAMPSEAPTLAMLLVPSPQPGLGEPALVPADLPPTY
ncbi:MAG: hypothetical protein JNN03_00510 [Rubrivivax sp.]|nr:hypothetical protein [Rubrivivax sp.]